MRSSLSSFWHLVFFIVLFLHCGDVHSETLLARRKRAQARRRWWLHRTGIIRLTAPQVKHLKAILALHHSRDPQFLQALDVEMDPAWTGPWKCATCHKNKWEEGCILRQVWRHLGKWCSACNAETGVNGGPPTKAGLIAPGRTGGSLRSTEQTQSVPRTVQRPATVDNQQHQAKTSRSRIADVVSRKRLKVAPKEKKAVAREMEGRLRRYHLHQTRPHGLLWTMPPFLRWPHYRLRLQQQLPM